MLLGACLHHLLTLATACHRIPLSNKFATYVAFYNTQFALALAYYNELKSLAP